MSAQAVAIIASASFVVVLLVVAAVSLAVRARRRRVRVRLSVVELPNVSVSVENTSDHAVRVVQRGFLLTSRAWIPWLSPKTGKEEWYFDADIELAVSETFVWDEDVVDLLGRQQGKRGELRAYVELADGSRSWSPRSLVGFTRHAGV